MICNEQFQDNGDLKGFSVFSGSSFYGSFPFRASLDDFNDHNHSIHIEIEHGASLYTLSQIKEIRQKLGELILTVETNQNVRKKNGK